MITNNERLNNMYIIRSAVEASRGFSKTKLIMEDIGLSVTITPPGVLERAPDVQGFINFVENRKSMQKAIDEFLKQLNGGNQ